MGKTKIASLENIMATRMKQTWKHRVDIKKHSDLDTAAMKAWCLKNCQGTWNAETVWAHYFQFENDYDAMMFMLKWGTAPGNKLK